MKKLIAMIATVAVVLSMGVTSLAAAVEKTESPKEEKITVTVKDHPEVTTAFYEVADEDELKVIFSEDAVKDLKDKVKTDDGQKARVFYGEVTGKAEVKDGKVETSKFWGDKLAVENDGTFSFAFTFDGANDVTNVLVYTSDGTWKDAIDWSVKDGTVYVETQDDAWFAFVLGEAKAADADNGGAAANNSKKSAATGYNSTAYIVCAIALAAGAAFFFGTSKKSAKEMM